MIDIEMLNLKNLKKIFKKKKINFPKIKQNKNFKSFYGTISASFILVFIFYVTPLFVDLTKKQISGKKNYT